MRLQRVVGRNPEAHGGHCTWPVSGLSHECRVIDPLAAGIGMLREREGAIRRGGIEGRIHYTGLRCTSHTAVLHPRVGRGWIGGHIVVGRVILHHTVESHQSVISFEGDARRVAGLVAVARAGHR